ncbi:MAG: hypothetical protein WCC06_01100 [Candidatus Aminicenantales bacterium]
MFSIHKKFRSVVIHKAVGRSIVILLVILWAAGCSAFKTYLTESRLPNRPIVIDGKSDEWRSALYFVEEGKISFGFFNDQNYLYVCLVAAGNMMRAQIMMRGLTVWFDPQGGKKKAFGIKYPLGRSPREPVMLPEEFQEEEVLEDSPEKSFDELEIIPSEKGDPQKMTLAEARGIEIKAVPSSGLLVYELKIPLLQTEQTSFAVGAQPGKTIGVGFETGKFNPGQLRGRRPGGMPGGGGMPPMGRPMGGRQGRGGMGGFGRGPEMLKGLKIWILVQLSSAKGNNGPQILLF